MKEDYKLFSANCKHLNQSRLLICIFFSSAHDVIRAPDKGGGGGGGGGFEDHSKIIILLNINISCDPSLEQSREMVLMIGHKIRFNGAV